MTPEEAIKIIEYYYPKRKRFTCGIRIDVNDKECTFGRALTVAMQALKEIQQYRAIGTVEECREAVEKQKPKRPIKDKWKHDCCPSCGWFVSEETGWGDRYNPHCENCGQAIQWDENLEGREDE